MKKITREQVHITFLIINILAGINVITDNPILGAINFFLAGIFTGFLIEGFHTVK